jgi:hypothetical protein
MTVLRPSRRDREDATLLSRYRLFGSTRSLGATRPTPEDGSGEPSDGIPIVFGSGIREAGLGVRVNVIVGEAGR